MPIYGPKFQNLGGGQKNFWTFWHLKNWHFLAPANGQSVTYPKIQTEVCRVPSGTPMDWFLMKSVNAEYPLSCCKCVEKSDPLQSNPCQTPQVCHTPQKWYHHIAQGPAHLKPPHNTLKPHCSFIKKKIDFLKAPNFDKSTRNSPGVTKNWHMSKLTKKSPRICNKLSWVQIWQKNSNGRCPKLPKRNSHAPCYKVVTSMAFT